MPQDGRSTLIPNRCGLDGLTGAALQARLGGGVDAETTLDGLSLMPTRLNMGRRHAVALRRGALAKSRRVRLMTPSTEARRCVKRDITPRVGRKGRAATL